MLRLFDRAGIDLVDEESWETDRSQVRIDEDVAAHKKLVAQLKADPCPDAKSQAQMIEGQLACTRVRAEEVAGASGLPDHPAAYVQAEPVGRELLRQLP